MSGYEDDYAVEHILSNLPEEIASKYSEDDLLLVIDAIFDFYESKGFFELSNVFDESDEDEFEESELCDYVVKALRRDKANKIALEDVPLIVHLELEYEDSICDDDEL